MINSQLRRMAGVAAAGVALTVGFGTAQAAPVITSVNTDLSTAPYSFSYLGSTFTFTGTGGFPNYLAVSTTGDAAVRTVFGGPSTDFTNRGTVVYDGSTLGGFGSFAASTPIPYTNGENFLGLRVTSAGQSYYGFLYSTNTVLNSFAFETSPNTSITASTAAGATGAVPEPTSWAMMVGGFGLIGAAVRRRQRMTVLAA